MVVDSLLLLGGALALAGPLAFAPWPCAAFAGFVAVLAWRAGRQRLLVCGLLLLLGNLWRVHRQLHAYEAERAALLAAFQSPRTCHGLGRVVARPSALADRSLSLAIEPSELVCEPSAYVAEEVRLLSPRAPSLRLGLPADRQEGALARGDLVAFEGSLALTSRFVLADLPDPRPRAAARGVQLSGQAVWMERRAEGRGPPAWIDALRARVRQRIHLYFADDSVALAEALVLGDHVLDEGDERAFAASGLSHLLAVSGMHLVLAIASLQRMLRAFLVRTAWAARFDMRRPTAALAALLALAYADFAGGSGSAWRAALSMGLTLFAAAHDRALGPARALGASVLVLAALDPLIAFDLSFALSVLATCGLLVFGAPCTAACDRLRMPKWIGKLLGPTLAASLACAPLLARIAPALPTVAMLLNVLAIPLSESIALPWCLLFCVLPPWTPLLAGCARAAGGALQLTGLLARLGSALPHLPVLSPTPLQLALLAAGFVAFARAGGPGSLRVTVGRWLLPLGGALLAAEGMHRWQVHPRGHLRVLQLDVGQGDAALIDLPDGSAMLIDSGGIVGGADVGERVLGPILRARRRDHLRVVVVTHPHPDHFGGLASGAAGVRVDEIWDTALPVAEHAGEHAGPVAAMKDAWMAWREAQRAAGAVLRGPGELCGEQWVGGVRVRVLQPCPEVDANLGANDNSLVLRLEHGSRSALFVGDAEREEEHKLLALPPALLRADVLKVGHHGSRTSTSPELLLAVRPSLALVSAGARNRFGHPHPHTLQTLAAVPLARTDRMGALYMDLEQLEVQSCELSP